MSPTIIAEERRCLVVTSLRVLTREDCSQLIDQRRAGEIEDPSVKTLNLEFRDGRNIA